MEISVPLAPRHDFRTPLVTRLLQDQWVYFVVGSVGFFLLGYHIATRISFNLAPSFYSLIPGPTLSWGIVALVYSLVGFVIYTLATLRPEYFPVSVRFAAFQLFNAYLGLTLLLYLGYS